MTNNISVYKGDIPILSDKQAREIATCVIQDIKGFIAAHQEEYQLYLLQCEQKGGVNSG